MTVMIANLAIGRLHENNVPSSRFERGLPDSASDPPNITATSTATPDDVLINCSPQIIKCYDYHSFKYYPLFPECKLWSCARILYYEMNSHDDSEMGRIYRQLRVELASRLDLRRYPLQVSR